MVLSKEARLAKLRELANIEGYDTIEEMLEEVACDAVSPAICTHEDCDYM
jgi:ASC-1-like (ASCH) protein